MVRRNCRVAPARRTRVEGGGRFFLDQSAMELSTFRKALPLDVRLYSTRGGASRKTLRLIMPQASNSFNRMESVRVLMPPTSSRSSENRREGCSERRRSRTNAARSCTSRQTISTGQLCFDAFILKVSHMHKKLSNKNSQVSLRVLRSTRIFWLENPALVSFSGYQ